MVMINVNFLILMVRLCLRQRMSLLEIHARLSGVISGVIRFQSDNLLSNSSEGKGFCTVLGSIL